jgi:hypothetical protein
VGGINLFAYTENNPVNDVDPLGLFTSHGALSNVAFHAEKCKKLSSEATSFSANVDYMEYSQRPENAAWHAMSNGEVNESAQSARRNTEEYINENLRKCNAEGLGRALHAEQDKYAGGHRGYQPWYGKGGRVKHWLKDETGGGEWEAVRASIALIKRFKEMCPCACGE